MNPTLNITATERTRATVSNSNGVGRSVEFDCGVIVTKTLKDMGLKFTLDAPEDMQLHSELQAMGVEQRGKLVGEEAANILIGQVEGDIPRNKVEKRVVRTRLVIRGTTK
jgi:hypothetical protein